VAVYDTTNQSGKPLQLEQADNQLKGLAFFKVFFLIVSPTEVYLVLEDRLANKLGLAQPTNDLDNKTKASLC